MVVGALWGELGFLGLEFYVGYVVVAGVFLLLLIKGENWADDLFVECMLADSFCVVQAFRKINAVTVPKMVGVPKNDEEDAARGNQ